MDRKLLGNGTSKTTITENQKLFEYMMFAGIAVGIILATWTTYQQKKTKDKTASRNLLVSTGSGYIIAASCIFMLVPFAIKAHTAQIQPDASLIKKIMASFDKIIIYPLPYTLTIGIFIYAAILIFLYIDQLTKHNVANEYFTWSYTFSFLLVIQSFLLLHYIMSKDTGIPSSLRYVIYLLSVFNAIVLGIMQTILKFFSTDG